MSFARWLLPFPTFFMIAMSILTGCHAPIDPKKAGAAAAAAATGQDYMVAVVDKVPLYAFGPQQLGVPDELLNKDDLVRVIKTQLGFTLVQTGKGQVGWVPTEDMAPASSDMLVEAGSGYESPSSLARETATPASTQQKKHPAKRDTAIVKRHTIPGHRATPTPSPHRH
jgi:hypothetical protein